MSDVEHITKVIPLDANFQAEVARLDSEGWELVPGVVPVAVYHLVRVKGVLSKPKPASQSGLGSLLIDDEKVYVIKENNRVN